MCIDEDGLRAVLRDEERLRKQARRRRAQAVLLTCVMVAVTVLTVVTVTAAVALANADKPVLVVAVYGAATSFGLLSSIYFVVQDLRGRWGKRP